jgi:hypothetical protein
MHCRCVLLVTAKKYKFLFSAHFRGCTMYDYCVDDDNSNKPWNLGGASESSSDLMMGPVRLTIQTPSFAYTHLHTLTKAQPHRDY